MKETLLRGAKVVGGFLAVALCAMPQAYTISAKPGAVNYVEGNVMLDGQSLGSSSLKTTFMNAGSLLETRDGKAEVLLSPGVFLRVGENSEVRMLKPSLIDTQIAVEAGESMVEVDQYVRDSHLTVSVRGGIAEIEKSGLYRFMADGESTVATIDGKAEVTFGEKHANVGKGHEAVLNDALKTRNFDKDREDELYAWSNIRAQYNASLTYQAARTAYAASNTGAGSYSGYNGYGYNNGFMGQGWLWSAGFNSWLWMPGGQFFSPFGWGFYGPGYVAYAPVVMVPVVAGGGRPVVPVVHPKPGSGTTISSVTVPVNPKQMPAIGVYAASPARFATASAQAARTVSANGGLRTYAGAPAARGYAGGGPAGGGGSQARSAGSGGSANSGGMSAPRSAGGATGGGGMSGAHSAGGGGGRGK